MAVDPLAWRVEQACAAAYPAAERLRVGDWWVARSGGGSRRINAASAAVPGAAMNATTLATIDARYAAADLPTIVRVTDLAPAASALLDADGFAAPESRTRTLLRPPGDVVATDAAIITDHAVPMWLAARRRFAPDATDPADIANRLRMSAAYARRQEGDAIHSIGYAALRDGIAVIEAIGTDPAARRQGHARAIVAALIDRATRHRARHIAPQVEETNAPARALYADMGFVTDLYGYHYRRRAPCPSRG